ncbi:hypothetical protein T190607A02C_20115 [Tenacibaculum sp. 190524A02b]
MLVSVVKCRFECFCEVLTKRKMYRERYVLLENTSRYKIISHFISNNFTRSDSFNCILFFEERPK